MDRDLAIESLSAAQKQWAENLGWLVGDRVQTPFGEREVVGMGGKWLAYYVAPEAAARGIDMSHGHVLAATATRLGGQMELFA